MKKFLSCALALFLVFQCSGAAFALENNNQQDEYYYEQETSVGETALSIIDSSEAVKYFQDIQVMTGYELVSATTKSVYVMETVADNGEIIDSHLMNKKEVAEYKEKLATNQTLLNSTRANTEVGSGDQTHQGNKLSIHLVVYKDSSTNYYAYGTADWENGVYISGVNGPDVGYDFIALSWGGDGELKSTASNTSISGEYQYEKGNIDFSTSKSDSYKGYCWQFDEITGFPKYFADYIDCYAKISKTYSASKGKETNVKLTYIHTYQSNVGSISFTGGTSGAAAGVSLSSCANQWQIEVDVSGIKY